MRFKEIKKEITFGLIAVFFACLLISLFMIADTLGNSERFQHLYTFLLFANIVAVIALLGLIVLNLGQLIRQIRRRRFGARLITRLVGLFIILSVVPVALVYYFSLQFIQQQLDSLFNVNAEQGIENALELGQAALDIKLRDSLRQTEFIVKQIDIFGEHLIDVYLDDLRQQMGAEEVTLFGYGGEIIAFNSSDTARLLPTQPDNKLLLKLNLEENKYVTLDAATNEGKRYIRTVVKYIQSDQAHYIHALFPLTAHFAELTKSSEAAYSAYQKQKYLQTPLKQNFILVLSLVLVLSIFSMIWMSFFSARRFVAPLVNLIGATKAVAAGNYEKQLPVNQLGELNFLVNAFNDMTKKIALARDEAKRSQQLAENQRIHLEIILKHMSSGMMALDQQNCLKTANLAANRILELPLTEFFDQPLAELQKQHPILDTLCMTIEPRIKELKQDWREEVIITSGSGRKILLCAGTTIPLISANEEESQIGHVIVFDDITALVQAQRDAAWSEVARRLAHEIKNPLTPIQLSAERLQYKYLKQETVQNTDLLERMTHTIIQQVKAMKEMVDAFSDYARISQIRWQTIQLNRLIKEVVDLYQYDRVKITLQLDKKINKIEVDKGRLRQLLHNVIKNAIEANNTQAVQIKITTHYKLITALEYVELRIEDNGPGIPKDLLDRVFEPYVTSKTKGTGLGLAIVKKIIEEHGGTLQIENVPGACITIQLPLKTTETSLNFVDTSYIQD